MDIFSPIIFAMAVIALVGLVIASFLIWWELRKPVRQPTAMRADHTRTDPLPECGGRVVYRRIMVE